MIDIIIPAYNAHNTIINTLLSIDMQTVKDSIKVYIVNDGSKKDYREIIDLFNNKLNISEITLDNNSGPGVARNIGLDNSYSDYVMFLDADDELYNSVVIEELFKNIGKNDVCVGGTLIEYDNNETELINNQEHSLHGKLFRRDFINNNKLKFNDTYCSEDNSFYSLFLLFKPKISTINIPVYFYKYNKGSLSDISSDIFIKDHNYNVSWVINEAINRRINSKLIAKYLYKEFVYNYRLFVSKNNYFDELIESVKKNLLGYYDKYSKLLSEDEKLEILNEYSLASTSFISVKNFVELLEK